MTVRDAVIHTHVHTSVQSSIESEYNTFVWENIYYISALKVVTARDNAMLYTLTLCVPLENWGLNAMKTPKLSLLSSRKPSAILFPPIYKSQTV